MVVDASIVANAVADDSADGRTARDLLASDADLCAPDVVGVETVAVLRQRWLAGSITAERFVQAVEDLQDLAIDRYPTLPLMRRAYELRDHVTAYDAAYVALAEALGCVLATGDARLSSTAGLRCDVWVVRADEGSSARSKIGEGRRASSMTPPRYDRHVNEHADAAPNPGRATELLIEVPPIEDLPSLGPKSARVLLSLGIATAGDLRQVGCAAAYVQAKHVWEGASRNLLWAMVAGLRGVHWTRLDPREKAELSAQVEAFRLGLGESGVSPGGPPPRR